MDRVTPLEAILRRDRVIVLAGVAGLVALAWAYLIYVAWGMRGMAAGMNMAMPRMQAWGPVDFVLMLVMWAVMMVAMMVPAVAPMILLFATINRQRRQQQRPFVPTSVFLVGYLVIWLGFAALATSAQWSLHQATLLSSMMGSVVPILGGAILVTAGVFQWTRLKHACLQHCRTPFGFLMSEWRDGTKGALIMGLRHGGYCLGCCWFLMGLMFVGGVMNLIWMAGVAAYILMEKVVPAGHWVGRAAGLLLIAWGFWVIAQPLGLL